MTRSLRFVPLSTRSTRGRWVLPLALCTLACSPLAKSPQPPMTPALDNAEAPASIKETKPKNFWPDGKRAAVSLTYDDAIPSQRQNAVPALSQFGLKATFFLTGKSEDLRDHRAQWVALAQDGHELGAHTIKHPCDKKFDWVPKGEALQDYDLPRMQAELEENRTLLTELGAKQPFSFAYPCGESTLGDPATSYAPLVDEMFLSARVLEERTFDPARDDLGRVPSINGAQSKDELLAVLDEAEREGRWLVFCFHGVGGDYISVELAAHQALLLALNERSERIWTAPYTTVAQFIDESKRVTPGG